MKKVFVIFFLFLGLAFLRPTSIFACPPGDVACGKTIDVLDGQCYTYWNPAYMVDGTYDTYYCTGSTANTKLRIDLGATYNISRIRLLSATDYAGVWSTLQVCLSPTSSYWSGNVCQTISSYSLIKKNIWYQFNFSATGMRYVTLIPNGYEAQQWYEIEVYPPQPTCTLSYTSSNGLASPYNNSPIVGSNTTFTAVGSGSNVVSTGIYRAPAGTLSWTTLATCSTANCSVTLTNADTTAYDYVCNVTNADGTRCSSNLACLNDACMPGGGWADCGSTGRKANFSAYSCGSWSSCSPSCGTGAQAKTCTNVSGSIPTPNSITPSQSCYTTPPAAQSCPTYCDYPGGAVPNGTCDSAHFQVDTTSSLATNLISYWKLDETSGSVASDVRGFNNGAINGTTSTTGKLVNARSFNGSSDNIKVSASGSLNTTNAISMALWVKPLGSSVQPMVEYNNGSDYGVHMWQFSAFSMLFANFRDTSGTTHSLYSPAGQFTAGNWYHAVATYDKNTGMAYLYINGNQVASANLGSFTLQTSYDFYIGKRASAGSYYNGIIDEVGIWGKALSATEVTNLYNGGNANVVTMSGSTTSCSPVAPPAYVDCSTLACHIDTQYLSDGACGTHACTSNAPPAQTCPTYCGYPGGVVPNGSCGTISCPPISPITGTCPTYCGYPGGGVSDGTCSSPQFAVDTTSSLETNLVSYWKLNETTGSITYDTMGYNNATIVGANSTTGILGSAMNFTGSGTYLTAGGPANLDFTTGGNYSIVAWIKPNNYTAMQAIMGRGVLGSNGWGINLNTTGKINCGWHGRGNFDGNTVLTMGTWYHVACVSQNGTQTIYVNGVADGSSTTATPGTAAAGTSFQIGAQAGANIFNGIIDEVGVWSKALNATEMANLYNSGSGNLLSMVGSTASCPAVTPPTEESCPTTCHTDYQYVDDGDCGTTTCLPNAPPAQACPTYCGYPGGTVPNGSCGTTTCGPITPPAAQNCPTTCGYPGGTVPDGNCGLKECPAVTSEEAQACPTYCGYPGGTVPNGSCGLTTCDPGPAAPGSGAGLVGSATTIDSGNGRVSQNGSPPGYNLTGYINSLDASSFMYDGLLNSFLLKLGLGSGTTGKAALESTCAGGGIFTTAMMNVYCYTNSTFESKLTEALGGDISKIMVLYPITDLGDGPQTISTPKTVPSGMRLIVFVNGSLNFSANANMIVTDNITTGAAFILNNPAGTYSSDGDLTLDATVSQLDGVYVFPGTFSDNVGTTQLVGHGSLLGVGATNINFLRTVSPDPGEIWTYEPKYLVLFGDVSVAKYTWSETLPN